MLQQPIYAGVETQAAIDDRDDLDDMRQPVEATVWIALDAKPIEPLEVAVLELVQEALILTRPLFTDSLVLAELASAGENCRGSLVIREQVPEHGHAS